jgi:hypothetical protein
VPRFFAVEMFFSDATEIIFSFFPHILAIFTV